MTPGEAALNSFLGLFVIGFALALVKVIIDASLFPAFAAFFLAWAVTAVLIYAVANRKRG